MAVVVRSVTRTLLAAQTGQHGSQGRVNERRSRGGRSLIGHGNSQNSYLMGEAVAMGALGTPEVIGDCPDRGGPFARGIIRCMRYLESPSARAIRESKELARSIKVGLADTRRQVEASRALVKTCRQLLRKLRGGDRVDHHS
jgi:hypothetical protein